ncbi:hypothetical protein [Alloalcanivorax mobilis]|uniref:hypothetical protein n=1 Tax=Alloalcanivorax mobilis TaxID=2019569 RepID=UPI0018E472F2|nr:hypothetical protein [Alloalcanivorax mobilis]
MAEKKFLNRDYLRKWLISTSAIVLTSVSFLSDVQDLEFQFTSPKALVAVMEGAPSYFPDGEYLITYSNRSGLDTDDIDYSKMAMVVSFEAKLARQDTLIGGLRPLLECLGDYKYCCTIDRTDTACITAGIWVVEPNNFAELEKLKRILKEYSVLYAFNDGSGFVTLNNARMGNGVRKLVKS